MKQERLEILNMVSDGVISAEEGERLIEAMEQGERSRERSRVGFDRSLEDMGKGLAGVGRGFAGMGKTIAVSVDQAVRNALKGTELPEAGVPGVETMPRGESEIEIPDGASLVLENDAMGDGSVTLLAHDGEKLAVTSMAPFRVRKTDDTVKLAWPGGDIVLRVPASVACVNASAHGGDLRVRDLAVPFRVNTLRGNIDLSGVCREFHANSVRGNVRLAAAAVDGDSKASALHGSIEARLGLDFLGTVELSTMHGEIRIAEGDGEILQPPVGRVPCTASVRYGAEGAGPVLALEALAGGIAVGRA